ncbi:GNAT family N-acetyltransferase [Kocuria sp. WRN011]|uniref:GNAT family N-acetyltransferase n=1 Tax=unclassified Kocuria TaxID=2649579 RepID=UPI000BB0CAB6|nr:GNAT family N-acetyltransferase [Kocuria sp. WRN011]PBB09736.1 GNAT family N-acetyltransferase [Kocuria sp. WRN011]
MIRPADQRDLISLPAVEVAAGKIFEDVGMPEIALDVPPSLTWLGGFQRAGRLWVATDDAGEPAAYCAVELIGANAHIAQVSVHPRLAGRRIGAALIDTVGDWAETQGLDGLSLTTFRDVPWNAPYYARLGFRELPEGEWSPELRAVVDRETAQGLDPAARVVMMKPL